MKKYLCDQKRDKNSWLNYSFFFHYVLVQKNAWYQAHLNYWSFVVYGFIVLVLIKAVVCFKIWIIKICVKFYLNHSNISGANELHIDQWIDTFHYNDDIMGTMASQITSLPIVYSAVYSGADQRKLQSSASLAFVRGIHRWLVKSLHKWPVMRKMFPFDDVIMSWDFMNCHSHSIVEINYNGIILYEPRSDSQDRQ